MSQVTEKKMPETKLEENVCTHSHLNKSRVKAVTEDQNSNFSSGPQDQLNLGKWATCGNLQQKGGWGTLLRPPPTGDFAGVGCPSLPMGMVLSCP